MWTEADPRVTWVIQTSLRSFRHELLVSNSKGIPLLQQHGSADDNVPAFHSRRMNQLITQSSSNICHEYVELEGKNHWFDGVMSTPPLCKFYDKILENGGELPQMPQKFEVVVSNPADMASRGGLVVDQLGTLDQLGRIEVASGSTTAPSVLTTCNILRFHFCTTRTSRSLPDLLVVDGTLLRLPREHEESGCWLVRSDDGSWHASNSLLIYSLCKLTSEGL